MQRRRRTVTHALATALVVVSHVARAQDGTFVVNRAALEGTEVFAPLPEAWRFSPDETLDCSSPRPDGDAPLVPTRPLRSKDGDFPGIGCFRLTLVADASVAGQPLALRLFQAGASEVFLDGQRVASFGNPSLDVTSFVPRQPQTGVVVSLSEGPHLLAIRYANPLQSAFRKAGVAPGFRAQIGLAERALPEDAARAARAGRWAALFGGICLSFAVLHGLLYAFHRAHRENLPFALLCGANAALATLLFAQGSWSDPRVLLLSEPAMNVLGLLFTTSLVVFVHQVFGVSWPRLLTRTAGAGIAVLSVWTVFQPSASVFLVFVSMLLASAEAVRVTLLATLRRRSSAPLVGVGLLCLALGFGTGLLANLGFVPATPWTSSLLPFFSVTLLLFFSSVHLSRRFARTNVELAARLEEVKALSEAKLRDERRAQDERLSRSLLEAELARKAAELEEARSLQMSMLPARLPQVPGLSLAARMVTATEVGGDYYDFDLDDHGTLTFAIGDATGHGLRAGTLVTATKSLFGAFAREPELPGMLTRSGLAIRRMNLRLLSMALLLGRYRAGRLQLAAAGMPPPLVFRAATGLVETFLLEGLPLGSPSRFPYVETTIELAPGDVVLLMSDGLPERLDPDDEMLGYDQAAALFRSVAREGADTVATRLLDAGDAWARGRPLGDDVTLLVLRVGAC